MTIERNPVYSAVGSSGVKSDFDLTYRYIGICVYMQVNLPRPEGRGFVGAKTLRPSSTPHDAELLFLRTPNGGSSTACITVGSTAVDLTKRLDRAIPSWLGYRHSSIDFVRAQFYPTHDCGAERHIACHRTSLPSRFEPSTTAFVGSQHLATRGAEGFLPALKDGVSAPKTR
jgi:hypothetical protein